jgi:CheY-like chemotaxis protein
MLPGIGGTETAKRLFQEPTTKNIPVIFMTALMGVENDKGDEKIIIDDREYLAFAKPLHNMKLLSEIRKAINRSIN